jgi:hypothetical protein
MSDLPQLQHEKSVLEREHAGIVEAIHELRARARQKSIEASATRQPLPESEIQYWKSNIARCQSELMATQSKLASVNKAIRAAQADQPIKTLSQLPREVAVKTEPDGAKPNGTVIQTPGDIKEGYALFLQFFRQLVVENIDPRLVEVFEKDAQSLVNAYRKVHGKESS